MNKARPSWGRSGDSQEMQLGRYLGRRDSHSFFLREESPCYCPAPHAPCHCCPLEGQLLCLSPTRPRLCASGSRDLPHSSLPCDIPAVPPRVVSHGGETLLTALPFIHCSQERSDRPDPRPTGASRNGGGDPPGSGASQPSTPSDASRESWRAACRVSRAGARPPAQAPP